MAFGYRIYFGIDSINMEFKIYKLIKEKNPVV
jgi:hypothetical protein